MSVTAIDIANYEVEARKLLKQFNDNKTKAYEYLHECYKYSIEDYESKRFDPEEDYLDWRIVRQSYCDYVSIHACITNLEV